MVSVLGSEDFLCNLKGLEMSDVHSHSEFEHLLYAEDKETICCKSCVPGPGRAHEFDINGIWMGITNLPKMIKFDIVPKHPFVKLNPRALEILTLLSKDPDDPDCEIVGRGMHWWIGLTPTNWRVVKQLLMYCLVSGWVVNNGLNDQILHINSTGIAYLAGEINIYSVSDPNGPGLIKVSKIQIAAIL